MKKEASLYVNKILNPIKNIDYSLKFYYNEDNINKILILLILKISKSLSYPEKNFQNNIQKVFNL